MSLPGEGLVEVELTEGGYLRLDAELAAALFPGDALVAMRRGAELWLMPLIGPQSGGLLLKQRNAHGDRSALVREALPEPGPVGRRQAVWDARQGVLRVDLDAVAAPAAAGALVRPPAVARR
jgi:hypothetical protein